MWKEKSGQEEGDEREGYIALDEKELFFNNFKGTQHKIAARS